MSGSVVSGSVVVGATVDVAAAAASSAPSAPATSVPSSSAVTTSDRSMVIDNISWTTSVKPWRSSAVYSSSSGRRCPPNPAVASALTGTPTMLPPVPSGSKVITVNETRAPSSSSTASSAFGVAGNVVTGRVSTPTASPSSEFDSVRTPTTNTAAAPTINTTMPMNPNSVARRRRSAIAVTGAPGTTSGPRSRRAPAR